MPEYSNLQDTAYYVFDTRVFRQRIRHVRQLLGPDMALAYAIKANPFLTGFALGAAEKLEVCSPGECRICDALGIPAEATVISGLNKPPAFLEALISASNGRTYTVESLTQFATLDALAKKYGKKLPILLRLTNNSQFGINEEEILAWSRAGRSTQICASGEFNSSPAPRRHPSKSLPGRSSTWMPCCKSWKRKPAGAARSWNTAPAFPSATSARSWTKQRF